MKDYLDFHYEQNEEGIKIVDYIGHDSSLLIPALIEDVPVTVIDRKAFMGKKELRNVTIPMSVSIVQDFAFAKCTHLLRVICHSNKGDIRFGRKVFEGCINLETIMIGTKEPDDFSYLAAALSHKMDAPHLLSDPDIGNGFWMERWDLALKSGLNKDDADGYENTVLCGEEDTSYAGKMSVEGEIVEDVTYYMKEACKNKCDLCMLRLLHSDRLDSGNEETLKLYLKMHGFVSENKAAYELIKEKYADDERYINLYLNTVSPGREEVLCMLEDIGDDLALFRKQLILYSAGLKEQDAFDDLMF
ncbi:MAG: leucine-rich repeat domain-containing protein [Lachnospiraceae bacterium]|nr:leucine-rich repeat domain-containing protein [Lachnospiraceae bacterium]